MGINYSQKSNTKATTPVNGLLQGTRYSVLANLEDCPFARTVIINDPLKGIFNTHDISVLNL